MNKMQQLKALAEDMGGGGNILADNKGRKYSQGLFFWVGKGTQ